MIVLDHFDFDRCRAHFDRHPHGSVFLTFRNDKEFSITDLNERGQGSSKVEAMRFPDQRVTFDSADVTFAMLLPVDPRVWHGVGSTGEVEVSTRQRRRSKRPSGASNEQPAAA